MTSAVSRSILYVSKDALAASTRYRALAFFPLLRTKGWTPRHLSPHRLDEYLQVLRLARQADLVVVLRRNLAFPLAMLLRRAAKRLLFDFDDAIFCRNDASPSRVRQARFAMMVRRADHVLAGNGYLAEQARRYNPAVTIMPTAIEPSGYDVATAKPPDHVDLVWIGSRSTMRYLCDMQPLLEALGDRQRTIRLKVIADVSLPTHRIPTLFVPWHRDTETRALASSHIGLAPMPDDAWTRGKCGLKILQYMAAGLPVVASPVGVHPDLVRPGVTGFLAPDRAAWLEALEQLAADPSLRHTMGAAGREVVEHSFSIQAVCSIMERVFSRLLSLPS